MSAVTTFYSGQNSRSSMALLDGVHLSIMFGDCESINVAAKSNWNK